jgi:hypothetical protein
MVVLTKPIKLKKVLHSNCEQSQTFKIFNYNQFFFVTSYFEFKVKTETRVFFVIQNFVKYQSLLLWVNRQI